jgi:hypothetical protein
MAGLPTFQFLSTPGATPTASSVSGSSTSSISTTSTQRYVAPQKRRLEKNLEFDVKIGDWRSRLHEQQVNESRHFGSKLPKFDLPFFVVKTKMALLKERFPQTTFRCTADNAHDHPGLHTETMIGMAKLYRMVEAGDLIIDMYGSVKASEAFTLKQARSNNPKVAVAYIDMLSPKAFIRNRKLGPVISAAGLLRYIHSTGSITQDFDLTRTHMRIPGHTVLGENVTWAFKQSLYYFSDEQIQECLNLENSRALALIHRHPAETGKLFDGEATYAKINGCVQQTNTLTGESYTHRDLSWLWDSQQKVRYNNLGAFTWTFHMVSVDTWIIELVAIPKNLDERFAKIASFKGDNSATEELNSHDLKPTHFPHPALASLPAATCTMIGGIPVIKFTNVDLPACRLRSEELYEFLCAAMVGKPRDPDRLQDLFSLARSHCLNASEFPGKRNFGVLANEIASHVILAFVSGLESETMLLRSLAAYDVVKREHSALLDGVHITADRHAPESTGQALFAGLKRINAARKAGDTFDGILNAIS